jgi:hypothetical protein
VAFRSAKYSSLAKFLATQIFPAAGFLRAATVFCMRKPHRGSG